MKNIIRLFILLFFGISTSISAQEIVKDTISKKDTTVGQKLGKIVQTAVVNDTAQRKETVKDSILETALEMKYYGIPQFLHETALFIETPARWRSSDWLRVGIVLTGTVAITTIDQRITNLAIGNQHYLYSPEVVGGRLYGEWYTIGTLTAAFGVYGILAHNNKAKRIAIELLQAGAYSELFTEVLKVGIGRYRPYNNVGPFVFHLFNIKLNNDFESMPSGHATSAFALSTVLFRHANTTFWKIMAFVPAGFTLFARIYEIQHWASDEFLGSCVGFATGMWVVNLHEGKRHRIHVK
ncbi:MAG TPA: phosphatase PAP2 family protein [Bacteroidia bacterium]|jgi:membrane-associated phospholipid phosphatase|nr:phosphatase PAP2 family protein [Bacteroidia bacterium]